MRALGISLLWVALADFWWVPACVGGQLGASWYRMASFPCYMAARLLAGLPRLSCGPYSPSGWPRLVHTETSGSQEQQAVDPKHTNTHIMSANLTKASVTAKPRFKVKKDCSLGGKGKLVTIYQTQWGEQTTANRREGAMTSAGGQGRFHRGGDA